MTWWRSSGIPARKMAEVARGLDAAALATEIAPAFLLSFISPSALVRPGKTANGPDLQTLAVDTSTADLVLRFLPVKKKPESQNRFVGIGRLDGNDISLPDATVSKFHAYILSDPNGVFRLVDADSSNGTFVERRRVPARAADAVIIKSGDAIRFGSHATSFMTAADALAFIEEHFAHRYA